LYNGVNRAIIGVMAPGEEAPSAAELHFEGDSLAVLSSFPDEVKRALGFSLRQLQIGREPTSQTRSMSSIGPGVYELKEADERAWYRAIYLSKVGNASGPCGFCPDSRKLAYRLRVAVLRHTESEGIYKVLPVLQ